ncbi:MAG: TetR/AcrR family transcriptional regulator [Acidobacteriota bacterium]
MAFQKPPTISDDKRAQEIYRRAAKVIYDRGFDATSMGDIARAVDLTKGGLYYYIKGKKALLFAIMSFALDLLDEQVIEPALAIDDPEARLRRLLAGQMRLVMNEPSPMTILVYEEEGLDENHRAKIEERKSAHSQLLEDTIADVLAGRPQHLNADPKIATYSILGMIHWLVRWYQDEENVEQDEVVEQLLRFVLHGLSSKPLQSGSDDSLA